MKDKTKMKRLMAINLMSAMLLLIFLFFINMANAGVILNYPLFKAFDTNGDPLAGGLLYTYVAGTSTAKAAYTDKACTVAQTNPIVLDANGEKEIYLLGTYKLALYTDPDGDGSPDDLLWTIDDIGTDEIGGGSYYYPSSDAVDHGVTGDSNTIKFYVDQAGSDNVTIYLRHDSGNATTTYNLTTSETTLLNIKLEIENGAILDGAGTLTVNGSINAGNYQIFDADFDVNYGLGVNVRWWGAVGDGATDNTTPVQSALNASDDIFFPLGTYITDDITIANDGTHLHGSGVGSVIEYKSGSTGDMIDAGSYKVFVEKIRLTGGNVTDYKTNGISTVVNDRSGISLVSSVNSILDNITVDGFENTGIRVSNTTGTTIIDRFVVSNAFIRDCFRGIETGQDSENYSRYQSLYITRCRYAFIAGSGNINLNNSIMPKNYYAIYIDGTRANDGHSNANNNILNHNEHPIYVTDVTGGYTFLGNQIFEGTITLHDSDGIVIAYGNMTFDNLILDGDGLNRIEYNRIASTYANTVTETNGAITRFLENRTDAGVLFYERVYKFSRILEDGFSNQSYLSNGHFNAAEEPQALIYAESTGSSNTLAIGGGTSYMNASTAILLYTAADDTTVTGSLRMLIDESGNVGIGTETATLTSPLSVLTIPEYVDNAAAKTGGLTDGAFYHTAGVLKVTYTP